MGSPNPFWNSPCFIVSLVLISTSLTLCCGPVQCGRSARRWTYAGLQSLSALMHCFDLSCSGTTLTQHPSVPVGNPLALAMLAINTPYTTVHSPIVIVYVLLLPLGSPHAHARINNELALQPAYCVAYM